MRQDDSQSKGVVTRADLELWVRISQTDPKHKIVSLLAWNIPSMFKAESADTATDPAISRIKLSLKSILASTDLSIIPLSPANATDVKNVVIPHATNADETSGLILVKPIATARIKMAILGRKLVLIAIRSNKPDPERPPKLHQRNRQ